MARGINKTILVGNLGADPEVKYTPAGNAVTNITIATSESWKDKQTGQTQERTEWHRVVIFNKLAEIAGEHLRKGAQVYIEGALRTRKWQDQAGQDRYTTEIVASEMQMLGGRGGDGSDSRAQAQAAAYGQNQAPQQQSQPNHQPPAHSGRNPNGSKKSPHAAQPAPNQQSGAQGPNFDDFDDDIPFASYQRELQA